jgi:hypothetical protein
MQMQNLLLENIETLNTVNYQIAELKRIKDELEQKIQHELKHDLTGQKTYHVDKFDVVVKTGLNYTVNKDEYEVAANHIPACFNPVKIQQVYKVDTKIIEDIDKFASEDEKKLIESFITTKPSKLNVTIKPRG